jgi:hypothetical protein
MMQEPNEGAHLRFDRLHPQGPAQNSLLFVAYIGFCLTVAFWARRRGRSAANWYLLSFLITPLLAAVALALRPVIERREEDGRVLKVGVAILVTVALGVIVVLLDMAP